MNNKIYSMIGIANKGGKVAIGYDVTCLNIEKSKSILVLIASDASEKTKKNILYVCDKFNCKHIEYGEKELLGKCLGRKMVSVLSVNDENIASYLLNNL